MRMHGNDVTHAITSESQGHIVDSRTTTNDSSTDQCSSAPTVKNLQLPSRMHRSRPSPPDINTAVTAGFVTHITPPPTPGSEPSDAEPIAVSQTLFHNYLRALHGFDPANASMSAEDAILKYVRINPGDVVLVHVVDPNGWADGTVLNTGEKGWLPTNYCEAYDHPYLRNLLNAMTQFWDLLGAPENASLSTFVRQDYIRGLIAGVRYLLERADCLHRDAPTVKHYAGVRRMRKGLLADLSSLVQIAKRLQETISESFAGEVVYVLIEDLLTKACKVVTRAASFLDVWAQETGADTRRASLQQTSMRFPNEREALSIDSRRSMHTGQVRSVDSAVHISEPATGEPNEVTADGRRASRRSVVFTPPAGTVAHRLSLVAKEKPAASPGTLASQKLDEVHDICISHIAAFIGHHLHSRPSSELVATTERLVTACRNMLEVVDEIYTHNQQSYLPGQQVKKDFQAKLEDLARSTQDVFRFSDSPDEDVVMLPDQTKHLISVGTSLISDAANCVVKTRQVIEQTGNFELRSPAFAKPQPTLEIPARPDSMAEAQQGQDSEESDRRRSLYSKMLPPPPPPPKQSLIVTLVPQPLPSPAESSMLESPSTPVTAESDNALAAFPLPPGHHSPVRTIGGAVASQSVAVLNSPPPLRPDTTGAVRKDSVGMSIAGSTDTFHSSTRDSSTTAVSQVSTRATTPEQAKDRDTTTQSMSLMSSFASISSMRSMVTEDSMDLEAQLLQQTYAHELTLNKDGQVTGGSLPALVEQLTAHNVAPDPQFVIAFFLTFRKFTEPREFAQALIHRFDYVGEGRTTGTPARLRIYNVFKGWLETYWNAEADKDALGEIRYFAVHKLKQVLPSAGDRLVELTRRITESYARGTTEGPLVSGVGKSSMSVGSHGEKVTVPESHITGKQLNALRVATGGGAQCSILDFDPREIARQITLMMMKIYCDIQPNELLSMEWGNPNTKKAKNIRKMCLLNTDMSHLVSDTILGSDDAKKRAIMIKQWIKIGMACLELNNYDTIMAIMCSINSSVVQRLKRTWDLVSKKTKARLDELAQVVDMSKNYTAYRRRLEAPTAPCLPFLGVFLTDLTFVMAGNPKMRELPGSITETGEKILVINFDMYTRIAKIISHVQRFQVPYQTKPVPELQLWIDNDLNRMRQGHDTMAATFHRRSLAVEPKKERQPSMMPPAHDAEIERPKTASSHHSRDRYYFFKNASFTIRPAMPSPDLMEQKRASTQQY